MTNKEDIVKNHMDLVGAVTVDRNPTPESTKNPLMQTGLFMCFAHDLDQLDITDKQRFNTTVKACEEEPGLYDRYPAYADKPRNNDDNAHDDATGAVAGGVCADLSFPKDVLDYGKKHGFSYNNVNPGVFVDDINPIKWEWWTIRLRFPKHIMWYYLVNKQMLLMLPPLLLWLYVSSLLKSVKYNVLLDYMIVKSLAVVYPKLEKFKNNWIKRSKFVESTAAYFGQEHSMTKMANEIVLKSSL